MSILDYFSRRPAAGRSSPHPNPLAAVPATHSRSDDFQWPNFEEGDCPLRIAAEPQPRVESEHPILLSNLDASVLSEELWKELELAVPRGQHPDGDLVLFLRVSREFTEAQTELAVQKVRKALARRAEVEGIHLEKCRLRVECEFDNFAPELLGMLDVERQHSVKEKGAAACFFPRSKSVVKGRTYGTAPSYTGTLEYRCGKGAIQTITLSWDQQLFHIGRARDADLHLEGAASFHRKMAEIRRDRGLLWLCGPDGEAPRQCELKRGGQRIHLGPIPIPLEHGDTMRFTSGDLQTDVMVHLTLRNFPAEVPAHSIFTAPALGNPWASKEQPRLLDPQGKEILPGSDGMYRVIATGLHTWSFNHLAKGTLPVTFLVN